MEFFSRIFGHIRNAFMPKASQNDNSILQKKREQPMNNNDSKEMFFQRIKENVSKNRKMKKIEKKEAMKKKKFEEEEKMTMNLQLEKRTLHSMIDRESVDESHLLCPICKDFLVYAVSTPCGHMFCEWCIFEWHLNRGTCPVCRASIGKFNTNQCPMMDQIIAKCVENEASEKEKYNIRKKKRDEWIEQKTVKSFQPGMKLDCLDKAKIWCEAEVLSIIANSGSPSQLSIHYLGWSAIYDEYIPSVSSRLAPLGFFTSREDISRYSSMARTRIARVVAGEPVQEDEGNNNVIFQLMNDLHRLQEQIIPPENAPGEQERAEAQEEPVVPDVPVVQPEIPADIPAESSIEVQVLVPSQSIQAQPEEVPQITSSSHSHSEEALNPREEVDPNLPDISENAQEQH